VAKVTFDTPRRKQRDLRGHGFADIGCQRNHLPRSTNLGPHQNETVASASRSIKVKSSRVKAHVSAVASARVI
jgi:hypothetical protein